MNYLAPEVLAQIDQEHADVSVMLSEYPTYQTFLQTAYGCRETGHLVAVDCLARLAGLADKPADRILAVLVARLHAWLDVTA